MRMRDRQLAPDEYEAMLDENFVGTLSLSDGDSPYAVQLEYVYHQGAIYMATYMEGRKVDCLNRNNRAVFTVFEDRHTHRDMIKRKVRCRSLMAEGYVETIHIKEVTNHKGAVIPFRILKFTIEKRGSWQCNRKRCSLTAGNDNKKIVRGWVEEARQANKGE